MKSRGDIKRLWVGVLIALPSGAGVALSVLGGNTGNEIISISIFSLHICFIRLGSLVGVAISGKEEILIRSKLIFCHLSASLLPPAVNSGLLFAYSILASSFAHIGAINPLSTNVTCPTYLSNSYLPLYTCNLAEEAAILGACSLLLTIVNIICIIIMALLILRIKEVVPLHQPNKEISHFFHHDVKVARDYNKTIQESDLETSHLGMSMIRRKQLTQSIISHWKKYTLSDTRSEQNNSNPVNLEESIDHHQENVDLDSRRKLIRLRSFAKEYELDLLEKRDYELLDWQSQEKVRSLVSDLIDVSEEMPSVFVDLSRLQPGTTQASNDEEYRLFYQELVEALPPKWFHLYSEEQQRRQKRSTWSSALNRTYSLRYTKIDPTKELKSPLNGLPSSDKPIVKNKRLIRRQNSAPDADRHSSRNDPPMNIPIQGTRFRISKLPSPEQNTETF